MSFSSTFYFFLIIMFFAIALQSSYLSCAFLSPCLFLYFPFVNHWPSFYLACDSVHMALCQQISYYLLLLSPSVNYFLHSFLFDTFLLLPIPSTLFSFFFLPFLYFSAFFYFPLLLLPTFSPPSFIYLLSILSLFPISFFFSSYFLPPFISALFSLLLLDPTSSPSFPSASQPPFTSAPTCFHFSLHLLSFQPSLPLPSFA